MIPNDPPMAPEQIGRFMAEVLLEYSRVTLGDGGNFQAKRQMLVQAFDKAAEQEDDPQLRQALLALNEYLKAGD